ncbi:flagellar biosynthesis protein FlgL [Pseudorhodoplanes sp.]|uniref:flagellin N-terminal helical domain-containing protein n=1 Tax=Pseudorhodoplanes sp. TaxID=1934341 RepID=UPI002C80B1E7|nr:flagellar biosynthesis protein FlgL [Pseudorhodoplanes sp.]HWV42634.1 flagellar biosynthesis protein FlgL [Pseudorhodoplanes sp.]
MSIVGVGTRSLLLTQSLVGMRAQLGDLQRQLATGKRADDYAGIGINRGLTVGLRAHLSAIEGYGDTIKNISGRLELAQTVLTRIGAIGRETKAVAAQMSSVDGRATAQTSATSALGELLGLLNTRSGDRFLFSGLATDQPAVASVSQILDGDGARAGLRQIIAERLQADLGAAGLGRLAVMTPSPTAAGLAEETPPTIYGFKLSAITSTLTGATVTGPAGAPPQVAVDLGATNPNAGEAVRITLSLPDGSTETLTLTATNSATPAPGEFAIGADSTETATNLRATLTAELGSRARTALTAASALAASDDFFRTDDANPPRRVDGPPFDTATGSVAGTAADTVTWYTGEAGSQPARSTAVAKIDQSITVQYGLRANEEGIRWQLQNIAALAAISMPAGDPESQARAEALTTRLRAAFDGPAGTQRIETIQAELAGAQVSADAAVDRHAQTKMTLGNLLQDIEGVTNEEVAAKILALQTSLQASLQTTAKLFQTSILNYL